MPPSRGDVLVTGANSGIGLAALLRFADRGWDAWGTVRSEDKAEDVRRAASDVDVVDRVHPIVLDVSDHDAVVARWPELPPFYAVVNNAGYSELGSVEETSAARARAQLDVNLIAPAVVSACALPAMRARGSGRIVMVSSMFGRAAIVPLLGWYHASKFGLEALSDVLRIEVAGFGVKVSVVEPGFIKTPMREKTQARVGELSERQASPYRRAYERTAGSIGSLERLAPSPQVVARTIASAVESRRPLRRYLVGADAVMVASSPLVPRAVTDAATRLAMGLSGPASGRRGAGGRSDHPAKG
jgi:NAD(P)-dependent dehydrogenase (short-subunit alcohol dehydrogenase family)